MISFNLENTLITTLNNIESFSIFKNGQKRSVTKENKEFDRVFKNIEELVASGFIMPAFGVSLNYETLNALKEGNWLQINFNKEMEINGLKFNALLFKLENTAGINLIRLYNGKYDGRCIYLDFGKQVDLNKIVNIS